MEIDAQIKISIKTGKLPGKFKISNFVKDKEAFFLRFSVSREDYIEQFQAVVDYLEEKHSQPDDVRMQDYADMVG